MGIRKHSASATSADTEQGPRLHRHAEALVQRNRAATLDDLAQAVDQASELAVGVLADVRGQPRTREVQRVHDQQRPRARQTTCVKIKDAAITPRKTITSLLRRPEQPSAGDALVQHINQTTFRIEFCHQGQRRADRRSFYRHHFTSGVVLQAGAPRSFWAVREERGARPRPG